MSCYFRHLKTLFEEAGVVVTPDNRKQLDRVIHEAVGVAYKDCPAAWRKIKQDYLADERRRRALVEKIRKAVESPR
ncbi:MAG: hypothetical protein WAW06_01490 [bacterium]